MWGCWLEVPWERVFAEWRMKKGSRGSKSTSPGSPVSGLSCVSRFTARAFASIGKGDLGRGLQRAGCEGGSAETGRLGRTESLGSTSRRWRSESSSLLLFVCDGRVFAVSCLDPGLGGRWERFSETVTQQRQGARTTGNVFKCANLCVWVGGRWGAFCPGTLRPLWMVFTAPDSAPVAHCNHHNVPLARMPRFWGCPDTLHARCARLWKPLCPFLTCRPWPLRPARGLLGFSNRTKGTPSSPFLSLLHLRLVNMEREPHAPRCRCPAQCTFDSQRCLHGKKTNSLVYGPRSIALQQPAEILHGVQDSLRALISWCWRRQGWLLVDECLPGSEQMRLINFGALVFGLWILHCVRTWDKHQVRPSLSLIPPIALRIQVLFTLNFSTAVCIVPSYAGNLCQSTLQHGTIAIPTFTPTLICHVMHRRTYLRAPIYDPYLIWLPFHTFSALHIAHLLSANVQQLLAFVIC